MRNSTFKYNLIVSFLCHLLVMLFLYLNLFSYKFNNSPSEIEVAVCGAGDMEKTLGGTGDGDLKEAQPIEDPQRTIDQSEIDTDVDASEKGVPDQLDKIPEGNNEKMPDKPAEGMTPSDSNNDDNPGTDSSNTEGGDYSASPSTLDNKEKAIESSKTPVEPTRELKNNEKPDEPAQNIDMNKPLAPVVPDPVKKSEDFENINKSYSDTEKVQSETPREEISKKVVEADNIKPLDTTTVSEEAKKKRKKKNRVITDLLNETKKKDKIDDDFNKLLSGFSEKDLGIRKKKRNISSAVKGQGGGSGGSDLTDSDYGLIKRQIIPNWVVPIMVQNADNMLVRLEVKIRDDGTVNEVVILDENRYNNDTIYHLAVDSARRAVLLSSPLKIPAGKLSRFRDFIIVFNPKDAVR